MKERKIALVLLMLTLTFAAFCVGLFIGKQREPASVTIYTTKTPTATVSKSTAAPESPPESTQGAAYVDGLLDTSDALSSWRDREKRLEILKDSHAGAFAVITACVYFLVLYGGFSQITGDWTAMKLIALGYVVSRCFSGLGVITLPKANAGGTVAEFSRKAQDTTVRNTLIVYLVLLAALMLLIQPVWGAVTFVTAVLVFLFYKHKAMKYFGGTTGDLSGYFLCLCEAWMVLALAILTVVYPI